MILHFSSSNAEELSANRAFLFGDAVKVFFYFRNQNLILAEEVYFFLMASMRKMRMNIPLSYTLEFFQNLFQQKISEFNLQSGIIKFISYRNSGNLPLHKAETSYWFAIHQDQDIFEMKPAIEMDLIKEINVNTHLLSNIHVHCPENVYAEIYARENDLDDVILLNPNKRIARSIFGNLLFLEDKTLKVPKQSEGAYISPLMENFITFIYKQNFAVIEPSEMIAFESQKAEEILMISDEKGIFPINKIRNKKFHNFRFEKMLDDWKQSFEN